MKLVFLGTGAGSPTLLRHTSAIAFCCKQESAEVWLFDCGEGTLLQLMKAEIKSSQISRIFITHLHADHLLGLPGLLLSAGFRQRQKPLTLYAPVGLKKLLEVIFVTVQAELHFPLDIIEIQEGVIYNGSHFTVSAAQLNHRITCFGYRIEQHVPVAYPRQSLPQKGKIITVLGDTSPTLNAKYLAQDANVLVHEATYAEEQIEKASQYGHSTTQQAAQLAKEANVKQLILTHLSARYSRNKERVLYDESIAIFPNVKIAFDLMSYEI